ncbi:hypothetical protein J2R88_002610 [Bradyrhizobium japonicum]|nr:hypothetical protein [Bradyrhizobium japonicum]MCP1792744.1 hypothetical protein [Bradyrhizobium japonicum]MCP1814196.1 hypothetical protein [Bradyrhizobium japonicum]MCP1878219.1 hypothetical protein [Bradyrhizobium japonicum]MCP1942353.1 hypothetical protein [Bradyrhizobium japonicum]MCP1945634.1 hypothetical protein [Bradyrhizobium japonicum]
MNVFGTVELDQRYSDVLDQKKRIFEQPPVHEDRGEPIIGGLRHYEGDRREEGGRQASDALLALSDALIEAERLRLLFLPELDFGLGPDDQPAIAEGLQRHPRAVVGDEADFRRAVEYVQRDFTGICVVGVLPKLADCGRRIGDLAPAQVIDGSRTRLERHPVRRSRSRSARIGLIGGRGHAAIRNST